MKAEKVKCIRAGHFPYCKSCEHRKLHDLKDEGLGQFCNAWGPCEDEDGSSINVRCVKQKKGRKS